MCPFTCRWVGVVRWGGASWGRSAGDLGTAQRAHQLLQGCTTSAPPAPWLLPRHSDPGPSPPPPHAMQCNAQVLQQSSVDAIAPFLDPTRDVIASLEQTRHRLTVLNCLAPGASTLITNLLRCTGGTARGWAAGWERRGGHLLAWEEARAQARSEPCRCRGHPHIACSPPVTAPSPDRSAPPPLLRSEGRLAGRRWLREYVDGCHADLHVAPAGPGLAGLP